MFLRNVFASLRRGVAQLAERGSHTPKASGSSPLPATLRVCEAADGGSALRRLSAKTGKIRTAEFRGAKHLVVDVVALVEGVVRPVNSEEPELVLASEFAHQPLGWNGRPVMVGHPKVNGEYVVANDPTVLESGSVGPIFNAHLNDLSLAVEAWIDEKRALDLGGEAADIVTRLNAGETIEVSVGVLLDIEKKTGSYNGQRYGGVWRNVVPDHLAFLKAGDTGACSVQMGCGAQRAAQTGLTGWIARVTSAVKGGLERAEYTTAMTDAMTLGLFRDAITDVDLRGALEIALRDGDSGFLGILAVVDGKTVVYHAFAEGGGGVRMFERGFKNRGGKITLDDAKNEVRSETSFIAVNGGRPIRAACGCGNSPAATAASVGGTGMKTKAELIAALIASAKNGFTAAQQAVLESMTDDQIKALVAAEATLAEPVAAAAAPAAPPAPAAPAPTVAAASPVPQTEEQYLAGAPQSIRDIVARDKAARAAKKATLVGQLKTAQKVHTEEALNGMEVERLEEIAALVASTAPAPDYSMLGLPRVAEQAGAPELPDAWGLNAKPAAAATH